VNITLSSIYFDVTKDSLYCDAQDSVRRRAILTVMEEVLRTMTRIMAPIVPHLAEEIHQTRYSEGAKVSSVFCEEWTALVSLQ
jgi:isoleucyl-tRNA synthetase